MPTGQLSSRAGLQRRASTRGLSRRVLWLRSSAACQLVLSFEHVNSALSALLDPGLAEQQEAALGSWPPGLTQLQEVLHGAQLLPPVSVE